QRVAAAGGRYLMLLHGLEQCSLSLRRGAIDFVRENHVSENRPGNEDELATVSCILQNLHTGDVGRHQIRRETDPLKLQVEDLRNRFDEERFRQSRSAGDQAVTAG